MKNRNASDFLDNTLMIFFKASVFSEKQEDPKTVTDHKGAHLLEKACAKLLKDGYIEIFTDRSKDDPRYKITFDGLFALNKYNNRPYRAQRRVANRKKWFEIAKLVFITANAGATIILLYYQVIGSWPHQDFFSWIRALMTNK